ncbi:MAG TPA: NEW3 domain-containing protein [Candidatus Limnocylindrales bacterium]|nr:NEW3 domain-containing protein [Candidatus Limnocylindrales bacterium]
MRSPVSRHARVMAALITSSLILAAFVPFVTAANGLEVTTPYTAVAVAPGNKVSFDLEVSSTRTANVDLSLSGVPSGWTASIFGGGFVVEGVAVTSGTPAKVRLDVTVPAEATAGASTVRVTARGGGAEDVLPITIRVNAEAAGDLTLTTNTPELTGASDKDFKFDLQFKNDTAQDVTVSAAATGPDGWTVDTSLTGAADAASTVVKAGSSQSISVSAKAAEGTPAGTYPIKVTATAGDRTVDADLSVAVTGSYSMTLSTPNDRLSASGGAGSATTMQFVIENTGTAPLTKVKLEATPAPPTGWKVVFDPADGIATIPPKQTANINATITPSGDAVAGDYVVAFRATATEDATGATSQIRFTVETSPIWAIVGIAIIALILGGLYYVFRTYGRR